MTKQEKHEASVVEGMKTAAGLAEMVFGAQANTFAVTEIYDYFDAGAEAEEFAADLKRVIGHAKAIFKTETPSPEQVFGLFERIFAEE